MQHDCSVTDRSEFIPHIEMINWMTFLGTLTEKQCPQPNEAHQDSGSNVYWEKNASNDISQIWDHHKKHQTPYRGSVEIDLIFNTIKK